MKVVVQQKNGKLFLGESGQWIETRTEGKEFGNPVDAIVHCIGIQMRDIRLLGQSDAGTDVYLYPFGGDPVVKAEGKRVRRLIRESHRSKSERRAIRARIDALVAQGKEEGKHFQLIAPRLETRIAG